MQAGFDMFRQSMDALLDCLAAKPMTRRTYVDLNGIVQHMLPVDVQMRADAELGAAWRRCEAALPLPDDEGGILSLHLSGVTYWAGIEDYDLMLGHPHAEGDTPAAALTLLAEKLEALRDD